MFYRNKYFFLISDNENIEEREVGKYYIFFKWMRLVYIVVFLIREGFGSFGIFFSFW